MQNNNMPPSAKLINDTGMTPPNELLNLQSTARSQASLTQNPIINQTKHYLERFNDELLCPICNEFLREPILTKECFHRFCLKCIQQKTTNGLATCPKCNRQLLKKVPFKKDSNLSAILSKKELNRRQTLESMRTDGNSIFYSFYIIGVDLEYYNSLKRKFPAVYYDSTKDFENVCQPGPSSLSPIKTEEDEPSSPNSSKKYCYNSSDNNVNRESPSTSEHHFSSNSNQLKNFISTKNDNNKVNGNAINKVTPVLNRKMLLVAPPALSFHSPALNGYDDLKYLEKSPLNHHLNTNKQRLSKGTYNELILWPDSSVFKDEDLPACYAIEFTNVCDDRDEYPLWLSQSRNVHNVDYLNFTDSEQSEDYHQLFLTNNNDPNFHNVMFVVSVPFKALMPHLTVSKLLKHFNSNQNRPLKIVYRFVQKKIESQMAAPFESIFQHLMFFDGLKLLKD